ncbi:MAG: chemotaxis protein CheA [Pseudomonadota bacterium]
MSEYRQSEQLSSLLSDLAAQLVLADPSDVAGMGRLLNGLEAIERADEAGTLVPVCKALGALTEGLVMGEVKDAEGAIEQVSTGIALMQDVVEGKFEGKKVAAALEAFQRNLDPNAAPAGTEQTSTAAAPEAGDEDLDQDIDPELYRGFVTEANEGLEEIEVRVLTLEDNPDDKELLNAIFRTFHTLKGTAGFLQLKLIQTISHQTETLLGKLRDGAVPVTRPAIDFILGTIDLEKRLVTSISDRLDAGESPLALTADLDDFARRLAAVESGAQAAGEAPGPSTGSQAAAEAFSGEEFDPELYKGFVAEATEGLEQIEVRVLSLEENPNDKELLNAIFRTFHTLKGTAGFLSLEAIQSVSHQTETLLGRLRDGELAVSREIVDFILDTIDLVKKLVAAMGEQLDAGGPLRPLSADMQGFARRLAAAQKATPPPMLGEMLVQKGVVTEQDVTAALAAQENKKPPAKLGEILIKEGKAKPRDVTKALREQRQVDAVGSARTIRVDTGKLDNLVDMVGELVIIQSQVRQSPQLDSTVDQKLTRDLSQLTRIVAELQRNAMSLRMVPIRQTFQKMIRLVRDLAKKSGKEVDLVMEGEETEVDRNMVDEIYEPLVHLVRNAVDHGLELPDDREAAGKPRGGRLLLRAYHKGGNVVIEISDDGRGLNRERILAKATEKGLMDGSDHLEDYQIWNLIFEPGFSTVEKVSEVSGRGVGMDVVRRNIEKLHGRVEITSTLGRGARFVARLPLTMAIIDGMIIRVGPERFIVPTAAVRESLRLERGSYFTVGGRGEMVSIRGNLYPLVRLYQLFGVEPEKSDPYAALTVVMENEGRLKCVIVDELLGKQELVIKSLGEALETPKGVAGGAILGDGRVGLIIDVGGLFELAEGGSGFAPPAPAASGGAEEVVDDWGMG